MFGGEVSVKRKVEVSLLGRNFTIKSDKDEAYLHQVATFVNRKFDEIRHQTRTATSHDLALLVALNLADELFQSEDRARSTRAEIRKRSERLLRNLDAALEGAAPLDEGADDHKAETRVVPEAVAR